MQDIYELTSPFAPSSDAPAAGPVPDPLFVTTGWVDARSGDTMTFDGPVGLRPFSALECPPLHSPEHASLIDTSHRRSTDFGLREVDKPDFSSAARSQMNQVLEENHFLYQHAAPFMETLYHQISNTQSMVLLTARSGMVLHSLGDADFLEKASRVALAPGVDWSEKARAPTQLAPPWPRSGRSWSMARSITCRRTAS